MLKAVIAIGLALLGFLWASAWAMVPLPMMPFSIFSYLEWSLFLLPIIAAIVLFPKGNSRIWEQPFTLFCGTLSAIVLVFIVLSAVTNKLHPY